MEKRILKRLLLPVARFCLRRSIKLQDIHFVFKEALLQAAQEELQKRGEAVSASRLSVMTGVHRKDVRTFTNDELVKTQPESTASRIVAQWRHDSRFTTKRGSPRVLSCDGLDSEFAELVRSVSQDLNPYTVLFEFERMKIVSKTKRGLTLDVHFYMPRGDVSAGLSLLAGDMNDLIRSVEENVYDQQKKEHLHLKTEFDKIPARYQSDIQNWLLDEGSSFHQRLRVFLSRFDRDFTGEKCDGERDTRVAVAMFSYSEESESGSE